MDNPKTTLLRLDAIESIEKILEELHEKLPIPPNFDEFEAQMDSDDIIGFPAIPDFVDELFPATYGFMELKSEENIFNLTTVFWYEDKYAPDPQVDNIRGDGLLCGVEIKHEFGNIFVYKSNGKWQFVSRFLPEYYQTIEDRKENTLEGEASLGLLQHARGRLVDMLSNIESVELPRWVEAG